MVYSRIDPSLDLPIANCRICSTGNMSASSSSIITRNKTETRANQRDDAADARWQSMVLGQEKIDTNLSHVFRQKVAVLINCPCGDKNKKKKKKKSAYRRL